MHRSLHCVVSGHVQGVGFRAFVRRQAQELGLRGWTRNLADGRVETLAQGEAPSLEDFLERMRRGPLLSRVDGVEADFRHDEPVFPDFQIKR